MIDKSFIETAIKPLLKDPTSIKMSVKLNDEAYDVWASEIAGKLLFAIKEESSKKPTYAVQPWVKDNVADHSSFTRWVIKSASSHSNETIKAVCTLVCVNPDWPYWLGDFRDIVSYICSYHKPADRPTQVEGFTRLWSFYETETTTEFVEDLAKIDAPKKRSTPKKKVVIKKASKKKVAKKKARKR